MKIVATMIARDEEDIIRDNIDYHLSEGVEQFVVMDNGSTDDTAEILRSYGDDVVHVISNPDQSYAQAKWFTQMARYAYTNLHADWVINLDADEFWVPRKGTRLGIALDNATAPVVIVGRYNVVGPEGDAPWYARMLQRDTTSASYKMAARGSADIVIWLGSHNITFPGNTYHDAQVPIDILHFPNRSYAQWKQTVINHRSAIEAKVPNLSPQWLTDYDAYLAGTLEALWKDKYAYDTARLQAGWIAGTLVPEARMKHRFDRIEGLRRVSARVAATTS